MTSSETKLKLVPINDLLGKDFFIPSYQRGYRWTKKQVTDLLEDIQDFDSKGKNSGDEFYCIQPMVVTPKENRWIVIDGQQRLTTIFIILNYFNQRLAKEFKKEIYSIDYETRPDSSSFLREINKNERDKNIDYFFMSEASETVSEWFKNKQNKVNDFESALLNKVKFIWYSVSESDNQIDIFTRLNIGKIPLTNAELIKALFLSKDNKPDKGAELNLRQLQIASEWDRIENTLQNNSFWFFITDGDKEYSSRIEFIFDLMKGKTNDSDEYFTFIKFSEEFTRKTADEIWKEIKNYFMTFEEWYNNTKLHNLVGFLIASGEKLSELKSASENKTKIKFNEFISERIKEKIDCKCEIDELSYENASEKRKIKLILLLFNIQTIVSNKESEIRFPFDRYKNEDWHIEHIRSVKSDMPRDINKIKKWLINVQNYFSPSTELLLTEGTTELNDEKTEILKEINNLLEKPKISEKEFEQIYDKIRVFFKEGLDTQDINLLSNLTLLDSNTNISYSNAVFSIKRKTIIQKDMNGTFVPLCTKNVFLKLYSSKLDNLMFWQESDANDYLLAIKKTLKPYF